MGDHVFRHAVSVFSQFIQANSAWPSFVGGLMSTGSGISYSCCIKAMKETFIPRTDCDCSRDVCYELLCGNIYFFHKIIATLSVVCGVFCDSC